jgi:lambda repressor-like predicted transcriptional regulator
MIRLYSFPRLVCIHLLRTIRQERNDMGADQIAWTSDNICTALWAKGFSLRKLALELDTTPNTLRRNIQSGKNARIRAELSARLGVPEWQLWPRAFPPQWQENGPPS